MEGGGDAHNNYVQARYKNQMQLILMIKDVCVAHFMISVLFPKTFCIKSNFQQQLKVVFWGHVN